ncbi:hypothetical protein ABTP36_19865, partial [Acinetobacter baumannii]
RNDIFVKGYSQIYCYEPMFGYALEHLPVGDMRPNTAATLTNGHLNFKNPACYAYGAANQCAPGDAFRPDQAAALEQFLT